MAKKQQPKKQQEDLLSKWANVPKFAGKWGSTKRPISNAQKPVQAPAERSSGFLKARYEPGVGAKKESPKYTGTNLLGVTVLHKSCLQPVFMREEAVDAAHMRR